MASDEGPSFAPARAVVRAAICGLWSTGDVVSLKIQFGLGGGAWKD
jgi:hypothetical protein